MDDLKVNLPNPCSEPWEDMEKIGCNGLCAVCDKIIYDLAEFSADEIETLLEESQDVCVRATIDQSGILKTRSANSRRILATIGATATFAATACQSVPPKPVPSIPVGEKYMITGQMSQNGGEIHARSSEGWEFSVSTGADGSFTLQGLPPSTYRVELAGPCSYSNGVTVTVSDSSVNLGELDWYESSCVIIGVMSRRR